VGATVSSGPTGATGRRDGAAAAAAIDVATDYPEETTVVVLPDTGERYLSTGLFDR